MSKCDKMTKPEMLLCIIHDALGSSLLPNDRDVLIEKNIFKSKKDISNCLYVLKLKGLIKRRYNSEIWDLTTKGYKEAGVLLDDFDVNYSGILDDDEEKSCQENDREEPASQPYGTVDANVANAFKNVADAFTNMAKAFEYLAQVQSIR